MKKVIQKYCTIAAIMLLTAINLSSSWAVVRNWRELYNLDEAQLVEQIAEFLRSEELPIAAECAEGIVLRASTELAGKVWSAKVKARKPAPSQ